MRAVSLLLLGGIGGVLLSCCFLLSGCERLWGPELAFTPTELPLAQRGQPYRVTIDVDDNDTPVANIWIKSGALPRGLTLSFREGDDAAEISGTPEETGTFAFVIGARCLGTNVNGETGEQAYTLVVE